MVGTLVSVEEYLHTSYHPDCDYLDGEVLERNLVERNHSELQGELFLHFSNHRRQWNTYAFVEQRVRVSPTRFRIPDVCVYLGRPKEQIFVTPPSSASRFFHPKTAWSEYKTKSTITST